MVVWPKRFPTLASAVPYARNPVKLANKVYAGRMGNGDEASGDGYLFRGRGPIQLTGRANYAAAGKAIGLDLTQDPGAVLTPAGGLAAACWFWDSKDLNELADRRDYRLMTISINGGVTGLAERIQWIMKIEDALI
jgi:putative chitinase